MDDLEYRTGGDPDMMDDVVLIHPLEEVKSDRSTNYRSKAVPSEQGRLLLEFVRKHIFNGGNE